MKRSCFFGSFVVSVASAMFGVTHGQLTPEDLAAGFEENSIRLHGEGLKYEFWIHRKSGVEVESAWVERDRRWFRGLISSGILSDGELAEARQQLRELEDRHPVGEDTRIAVQVCSAGSGASMRFGRLLEDPAGRLPGEAGGIAAMFPESSEPFIQSGELICYRSIFWDRNSSQTTQVDDNGLRSFGVLPGAPDSSGMQEIRSAGYGVPTLFEFRANAPMLFRPEEDRSGFFFSWAALPFRWDPPGDETKTVTLESPAVALLEVRSAWQDMPAYSGIQRCDILRARIELEKGFLPDSIELGYIYRTIADGRVFGDEPSAINWSRVAFEIAELDGAHYPRTCRHELFAVAPDYPATREFLNDRSGRLLHWYRLDPAVRNSTQPLLWKSETIEVVAAAEWKLPDPQYFKPACPPGVRYSNTITGETRLEGDGLKTLELDLKAGERPIHNGFVGPESNSGAAFSKQWGPARVAFWVAIACVGALLVWLSRRSHRDAGREKVERRT